MIAAQVLGGLVVLWVTYAIGRARGYSTGYTVGCADGRDGADYFAKSRWPETPPPEIMYNRLPHLPNDCGACVRYVQAPK